MVNSDEKWEDKIPNIEVLELCHIDAIEALVMCSHLCWSGHVVRMDNHHLPKAVFNGELTLAPSLVKIERWAKSSTVLSIPHLGNQQP